MKTEAKFKLALKEMMLTLPLEKINVTTLCDKCNCHRQTFYYHYQDIYDLVAAIFLNEEIKNMDDASSTEEIISAFLGYFKSNFRFIRSTYNSAAKDLTDDFVYSTFMTNLYDLWTSEKSFGSLPLDSYRTVARRFARILSDEISFMFKDSELRSEDFVRHMKAFFERATRSLLPVLVEMSK